MLNQGTALVPEQPGVQGLGALGIDGVMLLRVHTHDAVDIAQHQIAGIEQRAVQGLLKIEIRRAIRERIGLLFAGNTERGPHTLPRFHVCLALRFLWRQLP
jgi:hypothetical protein